MTTFFYGVLGGIAYFAVGGLALRWVLTPVFRWDWTYESDRGDMAVGVLFWPVLVLGVVLWGGVRAIGWLLGFVVRLAMLGL